MVIRLYQCFHDQGSRPSEKYVSKIRPELLCGCDVGGYRDTSDIQGVLRDNSGENISSENLQYSELTGYYWIWKNEKVDIVGIEHYRRHFIKHTAKIDDYVYTEDLATEKDIIPLLEKYDFILPGHQSLANTSIYDLYVICFGDQATDIVRWMKRYFKDRPNYIQAIYDYMSHGTLTRANMLITTKSEFDSYCEEMFSMIDFMKENMTVRPESRVWGYVSELFPMIYMKANNKSFVEMDIAVDDFDQDLKKDVVYTTINVKEEDYSQKDWKKDIEFFKSL